MRTLEHHHERLDGIDGHGILAVVKKDPDDAHADPKDTFTFVTVTPLTVTMDFGYGDTILHSIHLTFEEWQKLSELINSPTKGLLNV